MGRTPLNYLKDMTKNKSGGVSYRHARWMGSKVTQIMRKDHRSPLAARFMEDYGDYTRGHLLVQMRAVVVGVF